MIIKPHHNSVAVREECTDTELISQYATTCQNDTSLHANNEFSCAVQDYHAIHEQVTEKQVEHHNNKWGTRIFMYSRLLPNAHFVLTCSVSELSSPSSSLSTLPTLVTQSVIPVGALFNTLKCLKTSSAPECLHANLPIFRSHDLGAF